MLFKHCIMRTLSTLLFASLLVFTSCTGGKFINKSKNEVLTDQQEEDKGLESQGFVKAFVKDETGLDGCTFMLYLESDSTVLLPQNLNLKYAQNDLKVWLKYHPIKPMVTTCMKGKPVYVEDVVLRNE